MDRDEAIKILKQNKAAAEFYAGMVQNTKVIENELRDIEAMNMAIEALQAKAEGDLISRQDAIDAINHICPVDTEYDCTLLDRVDVRCVLSDLPSAEPKTDEEDELKFYYVESIDDYWIGRRLDNFYYAKWHEYLGFVWSASRYLPWGEHIVDENTLWKEYTYPSEPIEIPFTEWVVGFVKKYFAEPKTGEWSESIKEHKTVERV